MHIFAQAQAIRREQARNSSVVIVLDKSANLNQASHTGNNGSQARTSHISKSRFIEFLDRTIEYSQKHSDRKISIVTHKKRNT